MIGVGLHVKSPGAQTGLGVITMGTAASIPTALIVSVTQIGLVKGAPHKHVRSNATTDQCPMRNAISALVVSVVGRERIARSGTTRSPILN